MEKTRVAVVGVGALGEHHARIYADLPEAELVAVADLREARGREVAARYGCRYLQDFREILNEVDAVSLAVPTREHAAIGVECLRKGVHLLVEKPMAASLEEADLLIEAQRAAGSVLHVGHSERFNPAFLAVRPQVTQPQFFEAHRLGVFVQRSLDVDVVLDLMIHDLDIILHLSRSSVREVRAVGIPVLTPRVDIANARLEFEDGLVANVTSSRVSRERIRKLRFFQPHEYISIDFQQQEAEMVSLETGGTAQQIVKRSFEVLKEEPLRRELAAFLGEIRCGYDPAQGACSGEQGKRALELALNIVKVMGAG